MSLEARLVRRALRSKHRAAKSDKISYRSPLVVNTVREDLQAQRKRRIVRLQKWRKLCKKASSFVSKLPTKIAAGAAKKRSSHKHHKFTGFVRALVAREVARGLRHVKRTKA